MVVMGVLQIPVNVQFYQEMAESRQMTMKQLWRELKREVRDVLAEADAGEVIERIVKTGGAIVQEKVEA